MLLLLCSLFEVHNYIIHDLQCFTDIKISHYLNVKVDHNYFNCKLSNVDFETQSEGKIVWVSVGKQLLSQNKMQDIFKHKRTLL